MATTLKSQFGLDIAKQIAQHISAVWGEFDARAFCAEVAQGYEELALMPRARRVAEVLAHYLPRRIQRRWRLFWRRFRWLNPRPRRRG